MGNKDHLDNYPETFVYLSRLPSFTHYSSHTLNVHSSFFCLRCVGEAKLGRLSGYGQTHSTHLLGRIRVLDTGTGECQSFLVIGIKGLPADSELSSI